MKCAIMHPTYIPWLGYFDLIDQVDKFVFLDNVKVVKSSWHVRNKIKTHQGEIFLTIPLEKKEGNNERIFCETLVNVREHWQKKHLRSIELAYIKALFFKEVFPFIQDLVKSDETILSEFNIRIIEKVSTRIGISRELIKASQLKNISGQKDALLVSICNEIGCNYYLSVKGSAGYIERNSPGGELVKNGISLFYKNYEHPSYNQLHGNFIPYLSVIDLLFNYGFDSSLEVIKKGRRNSIDCISYRNDFLKKNA